MQNFSNTPPPGFVMCRIIFIAGCLEGIELERPVCHELASVGREVDSFGSNYRVLEVFALPDDRQDERGMWV